MHKPPAAALLAMLLLLLAAAALTVCFQPTDRVPGVAVRYYSLSVFRRRENGRLH